MSARRGSSLVEVLIALGLLVSGLLVAYMLLQESFMGFRRLDKRQTAEAISLNVQDRFFHTPQHELKDKFGGPAGGGQWLEDDELLSRTLPAPLEELKGLGFKMDAYAMPLDQGSGTSGMYFTTRVSWPVSGGKRQFVTHSRVVSSGLHARPGMSEDDPADASTTKPSEGRGRLLSLAVAGNVEAYGARAQAVEQALAGKGRSAPLVFEGSEQVLANMSVTPTPGVAYGSRSGGGADRVESSGGAGGARSRSGGGSGGPGGKDDDDSRGGPGAGGGRSYGAIFGASGDRPGASGRVGGPSGTSGGSVDPARRTTDGRTGESDGSGTDRRRDRERDAGWQPSAPGAGLAIQFDRIAGGKAHRPVEGWEKQEGAAGAFDAAAPATEDPMEFLMAAAPQLSREERERLVPGKRTTEEELAKLWGPLEKRKVPPGIYRYTTQAYLHVTATKVFRYEVLSLQADGSAERHQLISRRELTGGHVSGAFMEGEEVLERRLLAVRGVGPGGPPVADGVVAIYERGPERLYVTRPVILPDGAVAPFGREIAVLAWEGSEHGTEEGKRGRAAHEDIARRWVLGAEAPRAAAAAASRDPVAGSFAGGSYQERIATPRAGEAVIEEVAVNWASTRSRDAAPRAPADAPAWKSSEAYGKTIELINSGEPARALEMLEALRKEHGASMELDRLRASLLVQLDRWDDASSAYSDLAMRPEADASVHNNLAFVELHRGNPSAALTAANNAIGRDPGHLTAHVNAGIANELLGKREEAKKAYKLGLQHHPGAPSLQEGLRRMGGE